MTGLYLISPPAIALAAFADDLQKVFKNSPPSYFQLRLKPVDEADIRIAIETLLPICQQYNVPFILNDWVELATEYPVAGVHIGKDDMSVAKARSLISDVTMLGVSCYNSLEVAEQAAEDGADYVAFGSFYPTTTKLGASPANLNIISDWREEQDCPAVAIGGINVDNLVPLVQQGADFIAVSSAVWQHPAGPVNAATEIQKQIAKQTP